MSRPPPRLFVDTALADNQSVMLEGNAAHYLNNVLRLKPGAHVLLFNGRDGEWSAEISGSSRKTCDFILKTQTRPQEPRQSLTLAFAPLKKTAMHFLVEKATELGVGTLCPVITERTETNRINLDRMQAQAQEAAEQCERLTVPGVETAQPLDEFVKSWPETYPLWMGDETGGGENLINALQAHSTGMMPTARHGFLIGPEGGFTANELASLDALHFVNRVDLGPRILRAETAALAALTCWQALLGDWQRLNQ
jgi:16S rRNA (uracil1498-N3)-methyltransferase